MLAFTIFFFNFIYFLAVLGLRCCMQIFWLFLVAGSGGLLFGGATLCCGAQASHCGGFSCCRAQALGA